MVKYNLKDKIPTSTKISLIFVGIGLLMLLIGFATEIGDWLVNSGIILIIAAIVAGGVLLFKKFNDKIKEM